MTTPADGLSDVYRFADLTLDAGRRLVTRQGRPVELKALDFDLLQLLAESSPNVVNADRLAEKVWGRHFVSPENVAQRVMLLRQSLADDANRPRYIETVRNKGYRLIPVVERAPAEKAGAAPRRRHLVWAAAASLVAILAVVGSFRLTGTTARPPVLPSSIAVLPFENLSPDLDDAYFAAAMQHLIVSQLTKVGGLKVIPVEISDGLLRSSADIGRDLNVATVLGASVYSSAGRLRVTTRLTEAATGVSLWSESFDRERSGIFELQSDVALDVVRALRVELSATERERIARVPTTDPRARELYLVAAARLLRYTREELLRAIEELEQALVLDDGFTEAWLSNSGARNVVQFFDPENADEHRARAEHAANRALALDPALGFAHASLGFALWTKKDWIGAEAAFREAARLNAPRSGWWSGWMGAYATLQLSVGNFAAARDLGHEARAAEPANMLAHRFLAYAHAALGEWAAASALYESGSSLFGDATGLLQERMHWLIARNELAAARAITMPYPLDAEMLASLDAPGEALAQLRRAYAASGLGNPSLRRDIGVWAGHFGDLTLALDALRAAIDEQGGLAMHVWYPQLAPLRRLPEFKAYLRDIGMVAYWQEYGWPSVCRPLGEHDFDCD